MVMFAVRMPVGLKAQLRAQAQAKGLSMSEFVRALLRQALKEKSR